MTGVELEPYFILFYLSQNLDIKKENNVSLQHVCPVRLQIWRKCCSIAKLGDNTTLSHENVNCLTLVVGYYPHTISDFPELFWARSM